MEVLQEYVVPVTMAICFCIGFIVTKWVADVDNKWIPTICAVVGVIVNVWSNMGIDPAILLGGLASGLAATGLYQMLRTNEGDTTGGSGEAAGSTGNGAVAAGGEVK